ncbi:MAG: hypothetical protein AB1696_19940 [Planctomycetota bacterium]
MQKEIILYQRSVPKDNYLLFIIFLLAISSCNDRKWASCERCKKHDYLTHLNIGGGAAKLALVYRAGGQDAISWGSTSFDCPGARKSKRFPQITVIEKRIVDNLGNKYDLDEITCEQSIYDGHDGFELYFYITESKIAPEATELYLEMIVSADDLRFHLKDKVVKGQRLPGEWRSEETLPSRKNTNKGDANQ